MSSSFVEKKMDECKDYINYFNDCVSNVKKELDLQQRAPWMHRWKEKTLLHETCLSHYTKWYNMKRSLLQSVCESDKKDEVLCTKLTQAFEEEETESLKNFMKVYTYANDEEVRAIRRKVQRIKKAAEIE
eukprot:TRINITY_DN5053_c0_g2_i1.p1 TRINITY_DN5053_c0_g2~~TRINITY_DN5053_c0_g2_i1.p1  ORF type:complete len:151 (+),score=28.21 TRINITY_DN5053_c0_g2_i1:65-454(+)